MPPFQKGETVIKMGNIRNTRKKEIPTLQVPVRLDITHKNQKPYKRIKQVAVKPIITIGNKVALRQLQERRRMPKMRGGIRGIRANTFTGRALPDAPEYQIHRQCELFHLLRPGMWKGHRCFIIGGGPSLKDFDWNFLNDELTIGINRAFEKLSPSINACMDTNLFGYMENGDFGEESIQKWNNYKGIRAWWSTGNYIFPPRDEEHPYDIYTVKPAGATEFPLDNLKTLSAANNSGFFALNLAVVLGANPIYLLGFDMHGKGGRQVWWHDGYKTQNQGENVYKTFIKNFNEVAPKLKKNNIDVINLNPKSALHCFEKKSITALDKKNSNAIVVSFYTENTGYKNEANRLAQSLELFGINYDIQSAPNFGDWWKNTNYKATFMLEMMKKHPDKNLIWMDADSVLRKYPELFHTIDADIAVHTVDWKDYAHINKSSSEMLSGTIYIKNTEQMKGFVQEWIDQIKADRRVVEQVNLRRVVGRYKDRIKVVNLPAEYCTIFDTMASVTDPVIEQLQASRRLKGTL